MQNLKTHNILRNHIDYIKEIYTENELLKHIIENLKDENAKLTKNISVKQNMMHHENNNSFQNKLSSWQPLSLKHNANNAFSKKLLVKQLFEKQNANNSFEKELLIKRLLKKNNTNNTNIKEYNPSENLEINKLRVPKLLFILYK